MQRSAVQRMERVDVLRRLIGTEKANATEDELSMVIMGGKSYVSHIAFAQIHLICDFATTLYVVRKTILLCTLSTAVFRFNCLSLTETQPSRLRKKPLIV